MVVLYISCERTPPADALWSSFQLVNAPSQVKAGERIVGTVFSGRAEAAFGFADTSCQRGVATVDEVDARTDPGSDAYCGSDHSRFAAIKTLPRQSGRTAVGPMQWNRRFRFGS
jgi:hypothetical protein